MKLPKFPLSRSSSSSSSPSSSPRPQKSSPKPLQLPFPLLRNHSRKSSEITRSSSSAPQLYNNSSFRNIPPSLLREIHQIFAQFDVNGDGKISADELCAVLRSLGDKTTDEDALMMVQELDADGDGFINLQEFIELNTRGLQASGEMASLDELSAAFDIFDLDRNGRITPEELHSVLQNLGDGKSTLEDCKKMIRGVDRKGVGHVDFDDFKLMMSSA